MDDSSTMAVGAAALGVGALAIMLAALFGLFRLTPNTQRTATKGDLWRICVAGFLAVGAVVVILAIRMDADLQPCERTLTIERTSAGDVAKRTVERSCSPLSAAESALLFLPALFFLSPLSRGSIPDKMTVAGTGWEAKAEGILQRLRRDEGPDSIYVDLPVS